MNRHRILRVGRGFGGRSGGLTDREAERYGKVGLMFMCLNADIDRQFEFVQKSWLLNPSIHGLDEQEDPLLGREGRSMSIPTQSGVIELGGLPRLVAVRGGGYFFMPGRATLNFLCGGRKAGRMASPPTDVMAERPGPAKATAPTRPAEPADSPQRSTVKSAVESPGPRVASSDVCPR